MAGTQHQRSGEDSDDELANGRMGFLEHLDELRSRLIRSVVAVAVGMIVAFLFVERITDVVLAPVLAALPPGADLIMIRPGEGLSFYLDLALIGGVILAAPFVTYQVWRFIAPGLYAQEKRLVGPFAVLATMGTISGALFSHHVLFPSTMAFLATFDSPRVRYMPGLQETFELYRNMLIGMVAVFQIPTLIFVLARMSMVTPRFLWRHIKYAVLLSFVGAAILTPSSDPWNQILFAAPILALYVIGIGVAWIAAPRRNRRPTDEAGTRELRLVFAATILDQARKQSRSRGEFPRISRAAR